MEIQKRKVGKNNGQFDKPLVLIQSDKEGTYNFHTKK